MIGTNPNIKSIRDIIICRTPTLFMLCNNMTTKNSHLTLHIAIYSPVLVLKIGHNMNTTITNIPKLRRAYYISKLL